METRHAFVGDQSGQVTILKLEQDSCNLVTTFKGHTGTRHAEAQHRAVMDDESDNGRNLCKPQLSIFFFVFFFLKQLHGLHDKKRALIFAAEESPEGFYFCYHGYNCGRNPDKSPAGIKRRSCCKKMHLVETGYAFNSAFSI